MTRIEAFYAVWGRLIRDQSEPGALLRWTMVEHNHVTMKRILSQLIESRGIYHRLRSEAAQEVFGGGPIQVPIEPAP